jgi:hypothetical protein
LSPPWATRTMPKPCAPKHSEVGSPPSPYLVNSWLLNVEQHLVALPRQGSHVARRWDDVGRGDWYVDTHPHKLLLQWAISIPRATPAKCHVLPHSCVFGGVPASYVVSLAAPQCGWRSLWCGGWLSLWCVTQRLRRHWGLQQAGGGPQLSVGVCGCVISG